MVALFEGRHRGCGGRVFAEFNPNFCFECHREGLTESEMFEDKARIV